MLGSQQAASSRSAISRPQPAAAQTAAPESASKAAPAKLDESRVAELRAAADERPRDPVPRVQLANLYFDAERYADAIRLYEEALKLDPRNVEASTDLGVSYYYTNQPDRALAQFDHSLSVDPKHTKTILNSGIVRAFGKQDLEGAIAAWQRVVELAPDSPEGRAAKQAIDTLKTAHPGTPK